MSTKEFFAAGLKLIGIFNIILALSPLVNNVSMILFEQHNMPPQMAWRQWLWALGPLVQLLLGVYLLFGGTWITKLVFRSEAPLNNSVYTCKKCGGAFPAAEWEKATIDYTVPEGMLVCPNFNCTSLNDVGELKAVAHHKSVTLSN
jgi:hypothetical protein